jgi:hypothetical protein
MNRSRKTGETTVTDRISTRRAKEVFGQYDTPNIPRLIRALLKLVKERHAS